MGNKFKKKKNSNKVVQKSRKQLRKEQRKNKKAKKDEYFRNKGKKRFNNKQQNKTVNSSKNNFKHNEGMKKTGNFSKVQVSQKEENHIQKQVKKLKDEKQSMNKLAKEMKLNRHKQLMEANEVEDKAIKKLEKLLKLDKRKSKSLPKTFEDEGLDYLLDVCDSERIQGAVKAEMNLQESGSEFEEDFALITGNKKLKKKKKVTSKTENKEQKDLSDNSNDEIYSSSESGEEDIEDEENHIVKGKRPSSNNKNDSSYGTEDDGESDIESYQDFDDDSNDDNEEFNDGENSSNESFDNKNFSAEENVEDGNIAVNKKSKKILKHTNKENNSMIKTDGEGIKVNTDDSDEDLPVAGKKKKTDKEAVKKHKDKQLVKQNPNKDNITAGKSNSDKNMEKKYVKRKINSFVEENKVLKKKKIEESELTSYDDDEIGSDEEFGNESFIEEDSINNDDFEETEVQENKDEFWEDIYGRTRDKKGNIVQAQSSGKYVPPQLRAQQMSGDAKRAEALSRLKKQLKGLVNRLAENNMHSIANQIDELYMKNSRNDMNETLTQVLFESLISPVLNPERLIMEHVMLIAILHANVGTEVGAHFLQSVVIKYDEMSQSYQEVENKEIDNIMLIISHLYNFGVCHSILMYDVLNRLSDVFKEKEVELILIVLRSVGFSLRKDDPLALKELILRLQKKANEASSLQNNSRVRFMLDILLAVKNNNMAKMPQYDPSHSEHLKKLIKTMVHKGKYVTELKITMEDLLKAEERGRWWIVGSAWTGDALQPTTNNQTSVPVTATGNEFSKAVLELARKQRMNTDTRRNVFCILMTAEDYLDAFEKLLRLGLKAQQEQEIVHVLVHCLLQEKDFNPYYAHVAKQLCTSNRKHQMTIQYHLWDKLKELGNLSSSQITNLAKFLAHLFLETALPISVLKVMQFSEMDKPCVRLLRQILLSILLHDSEETMVAVFSRVARSQKLHMFRESLRLFIHHFVLKNVKESSEDMANLLKRAKLAESALMSVDINKFLS